VTVTVTVTGAGTVTLVSGCVGWAWDGGSAGWQLEMWVLGRVSKASSFSTLWQRLRGVVQGGRGVVRGCCHTCSSCEEGDLILCDTMPITGIMYDGGYGEYVYARTEGISKIPDELPLDEAAPLMCAGKPLQYFLPPLLCLQCAPVVAPWFPHGAPPCPPTAFGPIVSPCAFRVCAPAHASR